MVLRFIYRLCPCLTNILKIINWCEWWNIWLKHSKRIVLGWFNLVEDFDMFGFEFHQIDLVSFYFGCYRPTLTLTASILSCDFKIILSVQEKWTFGNKKAKITPLPSRILYNNAQKHWLLMLISKRISYYGFISGTSDRT